MEHDGKAACRPAVAAAVAMWVHRDAAVVVVRVLVTVCRAGPWGRLRLHCRHRGPRGRRRVGGGPQGPPQPLCPDPWGQSCRALPTVGSKEESAT